MENLRSRLGSAALLAVVALGGCRSGPTPEEVRVLLDPGPVLVEVAGMMPGAGPSERLMAAVALARGLGTQLTQRQGKASAHTDVRALPADAARAIDLVFGALESGETFPRATSCSEGIEDALSLGNLMDLTAPPGDVAQLDAVMWLGTRLREDRPGALGTVAGLNLAANAVQLARARGIGAWSGVEQHWVPPHFVLVAYAREAICTLDRLNAAGTKENPESAAAIAKDGKGLRKLRIATVEDGLSFVKEPGKLLQHLREAEDKAIRSGKELVRSQALGEAPWRDIEAARLVIDAFAREVLGAQSEAVSRAPRPAAGQIRKALLAALADAVWVGRDGEGVRALGLASDRPLHGLGLRNGDRVTAVGGVAVASLDDLRAQLEVARAGIVMLSLVRRGTAMTLRFDLEWATRAGEEDVGPDAPLAAHDGVTATAPDQFTVSYAMLGPQLLEMLEHPTDFRFVPVLVEGKLGALKLVGVRRGTLAAALGLRSGDVLTAFNGKPIDQEFLRRSFKADRQMSTITLSLTRGDLPRTLTWSLR